jgi:DNA-binding transcriptional MerR regulator
MDLYTPALAIGELARRTGIGVSTLRAWERRYGFPTPQRGSGGHRRYSERELSALLDVVRERRQGSTLEAALARARTQVATPPSSPFAAMRQALPTVAPVALAKPALLAVSRSIEDEATARADDAVFVGAFQRARFWRAAHARWTHLAARADLVVALAGVRATANRKNVWVLPVPVGSAIAREWVVICDSSTFTACLVGIERPGQDAVADRDRVFEALWTVEPAGVRAAASAALRIATTAAPSLAAALPPRLSEPPRVQHDTLRSATELTNRILAHLAPPAVARRTST